MESQPAAGDRNPGKQFPRLWAASGASNLGDGVALVAGPLLAATLTRDPMLVAGLAFMQRLPWLVFPLFTGALVDRIDRRQAMVAVSIWRAALFAALGVAVLLDSASMPLLYAVFFLLSSGETLFDIAAATILPSIVPRNELPQANARLAGTMTVANQFIGPPAGGFLFATALALPFLLGASGLVVSALLLLSLRGTFRPAGSAVPTSGGARSLFREIGQGVRWLWRHRLLRTIAIVMGLLNITVVAQVSVMVLFATDHLGLAPAGYGVLLTTYAGGAVLGSMVAPGIVARLGVGRVLQVAVVIEALVPLSIALAPGALYVGVALGVFGLHAVVWGSVLMSLRQSLTPDHLRGRVESVYRLIEYGGAAPGALLGGVLAAYYGLTAPFWFGVIVAAPLIPLTWALFSESAVQRTYADSG